MVSYNGKDLSQYTLQQLKNILSGFEASLAVRAQAAAHDKFTKGVGNKKAMNFPPPNPNFINLKLAIEKEIRNRSDA